MYSLHTLACNPIFFRQVVLNVLSRFTIFEGWSEGGIRYFKFHPSLHCFLSFSVTSDLLVFLFISYFKILLFVAFVSCNLKLILYFRFFWFMCFFFIFFLCYMTLLPFFVWLLFDSQSLKISKCNGLLFPFFGTICAFNVTFLHKLPAYLHMFILQSSFKNTFNQFPEFPEICCFWWLWCDGRVFLVYFCSCHISFFLTNQFVTAFPRRPLFILLIHSFLLAPKQTNKTLPW